MILIDWNRKRFLVGGNDQHGPWDWWAQLGVSNLGAFKNKGFY